jgi:5-methylcytosine-specific restriction endonuclease McrA
MKEVIEECKKHGVTSHVVETTGYTKCKKCRGEAVVRWRRRRKEKLVQRFGGKCKLCGYDRYAGALEFHHVDPSQKSFGISARGFGRSIAKTIQEAEKCILICANCHREVEGGLRKI